MTAYHARSDRGLGGIGRAIVTELVRLGMHVDALGLPDDALGFCEGDDGLTVHAVDVRDTAALRSVLDDVGQVGVLVNNAGVIGDLQPAQRSTVAIADALIDTQPAPPVPRHHDAASGMVARSRSIVFTGSIAATRPTADSTVYSATRAALQAFADGLRMDLHGATVRVTVLAPGRVETNLYDTALGGLRGGRGSRACSGALAVQPADIATLVGTALTMPAHVDVTRIEVVPTMQVFGGSAVAESS